MKAGEMGMDGVFSVGDEIVDVDVDDDEFWESNKSKSSDWELLLQQEPCSSSSTTQTNNHHHQHHEEAFLKSRLNLACAAVAFTRASCAKPDDSAALPENASQVSNTCQLGSQLPPKGFSYYNSKGQDKEDIGGPLGISSLQQKAAIEVKSTTSGSSRDQSDEDDLDGETATTQNGDPSDARRVRRMLSNRESARRSRRRKQAHLSELEGQVSQVKVENSSLLKRLTDINNKYSESAVDNRILKADVETLRAKVKMAEETVKRVTGLNPLFQAMSDISTPSFSCSPSSNTSVDTCAALPLPDDDPKHHQLLYHHHHQQQQQPTCNNHISPR